MDSVPRTITDLDLDKLKIMFANRLTPRRIACVETKYDLLKYLWKESRIEECYLEKYKIKNQDEIATYDDVFSRHLLASTIGIYTGHNEYAKQRLADRIESVPQESSHHSEESSAERFEKRKFKIRNLVRTDIGRKWWDFGRHLRVKQGKLDSIDEEQKEVARKIDCIFEAFEQEECSNEVTYIDKISQALIKAKRKDLARSVCEIMKQ